MAFKTYDASDAPDLVSESSVLAGKLDASEQIDGTIRLAQDFAGSFDVGSYAQGPSSTPTPRQIHHVATPTADTDAATKGYVDGIVGSPREVFSASPEIITTEMLVGTDGWMPGDGGELSGYSNLVYDGKRVYSDGIVQFTDSFHYAIATNSPIVVKVVFNYPDEIIPDNSINYPIHLFEDSGAYIGTAYFRHTAGELELYIAAICAWGLPKNAQFNVALG